MAFNASNTGAATFFIAARLSGPLVSIIVTIDIY